MRRRASWTAAVLAAALATPFPATAAPPPGPNVVAWGQPGFPAVPRHLTDAVAIAAGHRHGLAIRADGTVFGWPARGAATPPRGLRSVVAVAASTYSMALRADGTVVTWGWKPHGWVPDLDLRPPAGLKDAVAVAAGENHALALRANGTVVGWGHDPFGQASPPPLLHDVVAIAAGSSQSWALRSDGVVIGWGGSTNGSYLRNASPGSEKVAEPERSDGLLEFAVRNTAGSAERFVAVSACGRHALFLGPDGGVRAHDPVDRASGGTRPGEPPAPESARLGLLRDVAAVAAGCVHDLALRADGTVAGFGPGPAARPPEGLHGVRAVGAGDTFSLALTSPSAPRRS